VAGDLDRAAVADPGDDQLVAVEAGPRPLDPLHYDTGQMRQHLNKIRENAPTATVRSGPADSRVSPDHGKWARAKSAGSLTAPGEERNNDVSNKPLVAR
jgi:hypothetical protein